MALLRTSTAHALPLASFVVAGVILWGGIELSKEERVVRHPRDQVRLNAAADALQSRVAALESQYERHLLRICRTDLNDFFGVQDAIDGVVGVRQISTLNPEGQIDLHLPASDVEVVPELPMPVIDPGQRPPGREVIAMIDGDSLFGGGEGESGWIEKPEGLFFVHRVSIRRAVLLLVDPRPVEETMATDLAPWIGETYGDAAPDGGADRVLLGGDILATAGNPTPGQPDYARTLATRFGPWRIQSWDRRETVVTHRRDRLAAVSVVTLFVLISGFVGGWWMGRALRLAEQRVSFVNRVSHELKTPLTNILLNADLAADGADDRSRQRLARVQEETRRLARLIDNVLAFSGRSGRQPEAPESHLLRPLLEEVADTFAPSLERRGVALSIEGGGNFTVSTPADHLRQIIGNLLSNIEKYAAAGGIARIKISATGDDAVIRVSDHGPGIPGSERERIFLPFHRLNDRTNEGVSGTGLGLSISRDLAVASGGSLRLIDQEGPGATFELRIPLAETPKVIAFPDSRAS